MIFACFIGTNLVRIRIRFRLKLSDVGQIFPSKQPQDGCCTQARDGQIERESRPWGKFGSAKYFPHGGKFVPDQLPFLQAEA